MGRKGHIRKLNKQLRDENEARLEDGGRWRERVYIHKETQGIKKSGEERRQKRKG